MTARRAVRRSSGSEVDTIAEHARDQVLNAILDSLLDTPHQTTAIRRDEGYRIAREILGDTGQTSVMRVAGVRAQYTRGAYGKPEDLLAARKRARARERRKASARS